MSAHNHFALADLPLLDPPGAAPPLTPSELLARTPPGRPRALVRALLLSDDLIQREAWIGSESRIPVPAVLSDAEIRGEAPLPPELVPRGDTPSGRLPGDHVWEAYLHWVAGLADDLRSPFLAAWVRWEVALRNALARTRARSLRLDVEPFLLAEDLEEDGPEVDAAVDAWRSAPDPLTGLRALLESRWDWVDRHEPWFTFHDDELPAYAAKLTLVHRWWRTETEGEPGA